MGGIMPTDEDRVKEHLKNLEHKTPGIGLPNEQVNPRPGSLLAKLQEKTKKQLEGK